ncbi:hypothetical protein [Holophaga foetida]|uniref:hypothetical protein n=1 Tax=Holophaga foetida TaxID=35839 RepID=UPI0002471C28|nr:hypothetical protein [Holophaga foetida]
MMNLDPSPGSGFLGELKVLLQLLCKDDRHPMDVLDNLFRMGFSAESLVGPVHQVWTEGPARFQAFLKLAEGALEPGPMLEALRRTGYSELGARAALLARRPEWAPFLRVPGVSMGAAGLEVTLSGANYRIPPGFLGGAIFILEGGPRSAGVTAEQGLVLRNVARPRLLGPIETQWLTLAGFTPVPASISGISVFLKRSTLQRLPAGMEVSRVSRCPRLKSLPRGWTGGIVPISDCPRLERIPKPSGQPFGLHLTRLKRLASLGANSRFCLLTLVSCALTRLPPGLQVQSDLVIQDCPRLRALGPGTVVGKNLVLNGVPKLRSLPPDLVVGGQILWDRFS